MINSYTLYLYKLFWKEREQYMPGNSQLDSRACWSEQAHAHRSRCLFALSQCHVSPTQPISEIRGVVKRRWGIQSDRGIHFNVSFLRISSSWRKFQNKMPMCEREREENSNPISWVEVSVLVFFSELKKKKGGWGECRGKWRKKDVERGVSHLMVF